MLLTLRQVHDIVKTLIAEGHADDPFEVVCVACGRIGALDDVSLHSRFSSGVPLFRVRTDGSTARAGREDAGGV